MIKDLLNIQIGNTVKQITCQYDDESYIYVLDDYIRVGKWTIKDIIKHCDRTDYNANLEFVIVDMRGRERIKKYYYTGRSLYHPNECGIKGSPDKSVQGILSFFIDNSPIFQCDDWEDYETYLTLYQIKGILNNGRNKQEQLRDIKKIFEKQ